MHIVCWYHAVLVSADDNPLGNRAQQGRERSERGVPRCFAGAQYWPAAVGVYFEPIELQLEF